MAITYKTILAEAVRGYNNIQNALAKSNITNISSVSKDDFSNTIKNPATAEAMVEGIDKLVECVNNIEGKINSDGTIKLASINGIEDSNTTLNIDNKTITLTADVIFNVNAGWIEDNFSTPLSLSTDLVMGSATTPTNTTPLSSTSTTLSTTLSGTTLTVQASVKPTVSEGWVRDGTVGTVKIIGTVPTEDKTATSSGDITPSSGKLLSKVTVPPTSIAFKGGEFNPPTPTVTLAKSDDTNGTGNITSSITDNGTTEPTSGYYISIKGTASATAATRGAVLYNGNVNGWVSAADGDTVLPAGSITTSNAKNVTEYFTIPTASDFSLAITDKSTTNITVETASSGYYPLSTSLTGTLSASRAGWFSSGSATDSSVTVGRIAQSIIGSAVANTTAAATVTLDPGKEVTVPAGYYPSARIIRASIADAAGESINAGTATFEATNKSSTNVGIGTLSSGYYPVTAGVEGTVSFANAGWVGTSVSVQDTSVVVGRIAAATITANNPTVSVTNGAVTTSVGGTVTSTISTITTTKPSGTDGTDYVTIIPGAAIATQPKVTPSYTYSATAGYTPAISSSTKTGDTIDITPIINNGTTYYLSKQTPAFDGGELSGGGLTISDSSVTLAKGDTDGTGNITSSITDKGTSEPTDGSYYIAVTGTAAAITATRAEVTRAAVQYNGGVNGWINVEDDTNALSSNSLGSIEKSNKETTTTEYFAIPAGSCSVSGGGLSGGGLTKGSGSVTASGTGITLGTKTTTQPTSGSYITVTGSGSVSRAAVTRAAVTDTHTAGYIPAQSATTVIAADSTTIGATSLSSNTATAYYPISTVTPAFDGGGLSGGGLTPSGSGLGTLDTTNTSGISFTVSRAAVTRAAVLYNGAVSGLVNVADNDIALASATGLSSGSVTRYINDITVPTSKTLNSVTLATGTSSARTYLNTMSVNGYTTIKNLTMSGIIDKLTNTSGIITLLEQSGSYGITTLTNNSTITTLNGTGTITTLGGSNKIGTLSTSGAITSYTGTGTITRMTGSRTISNLGSNTANTSGTLTVTYNGGSSSSYKSSPGTITVTNNGNSNNTGTINVITNSAKGSINVTTNTGIISVSGGGAADKGVSISGKVVTVDGGNQVTDENGDYIGVTIYTNEEKTTTTDQLQIYVDTSGNLIFKTT